MSHTHNHKPIMKDARSYIQYMNFFTHVSDPTTRPCVWEWKTVFDSGLHTVDTDSRYSILDCCLWNLDSRFQSLVGFLDSTSKLFRISDSTSQNFPDSRIQIPLHGATGSYHALAGCWFVASVLSLIANCISLSRSLVSDRAATAVVSEKCLW